MAAQPETSGPSLIDLRRLVPEKLDELLEEEIGLWRELLDWDFHASAELVGRYVRMQALSGYALEVAGRVIGYSYYVCDDNKALIGDLYVAREFASIENENRLLAEVVRVLTATPAIQRIETQLMMLGSPEERPLPRPQAAQVYRRNFMTIAAGDAVRLPPGEAGANVRIENWRERHHDEASQVIAAAYRSHIDSRINDQYRSANGARRFLTNIVQYPGCGVFFEPASLVAIRPQTGRLCGLSLTSLVAENVGHITQVCVDPWVKSTGIGYELLRRSLETLVAHGCGEISLTVTAANERAVAIYERMGFRIRHRFAAYVWEGF